MLFWNPFSVRKAVVKIRHAHDKMTIKMQI